MSRLLAGIMVLMSAENQKKLRTTLAILAIVLFVAVYAFGKYWPTYQRNAQLMSGDVANAEFVRIVSAFNSDLVNVDGYSSSQPYWKYSEYGQGPYDIHLGPDKFNWFPQSGEIKGTIKNVSLVDNSINDAYERLQSIGYDFEVSGVGRKDSLQNYIQDSLRARQEYDGNPSYGTSDSDGYILTDIKNTDQYHLKINLLLDSSADTTVDINIELGYQCREVFECKTARK